MRNINAIQWGADYNTVCYIISIIMQICPLALNTYTGRLSEIVS